jgi:3-oxoacyl-(acyl-carrier-protein) synthase
VTGARQAYFRGTHSGHDLDLLVFVNGRRIGIEVKYADTASMSKSMHVALADLEPDRLRVVHPGAQSYPLDDKAEAGSIGALRQKLGSL